MKLYFESSPHPSFFLFLFISLSRDCINFSISNFWVYLFSLLRIKKIYIYIYIYLFWLHRVLVAACGIFTEACGIFVAACRIFSCGIWDLLVAAWGLLSCVTQTLSCGMHAGSSSLTRDRTQAPCIGRAESYPLDHHGSPSVTHLF